MKIWLFSPSWAGYYSDVVIYHQGLDGTGGRPGIGGARVGFPGALGLLGTDGALSGRDGTPGTGRDGRDGGAGFAPEEGRGGAACLEFLDGL